jgi:hypothetical protein
MKKKLLMVLAVALAVVALSSCDLILGERITYRITAPSPATVHCSFLDTDGYTVSGDIYINSSWSHSQTAYFDTTYTMSVTNYITNPSPVYLYILDGSSAVVDYFAVYPGETSYVQY